MHWGVTGAPDRWAERNFHDVYGPLIFAGLLCLWLLITGIAGWFGARRARRGLLLQCMIGAQFLIAIILSTISLQPVLHLPAWSIAALPLAIAIPLVLFLVSRFNQPGEPERTPNEKWTGGFLYYNPGDPAVMVEKRSGLGYTFNFASPWSWVLLGGLAALIASAFFLLS